MSDSEHEAADDWEPCPCRRPRRAPTLPVSFHPLRANSLVSCPCACIAPFMQTSVAAAQEWDAESEVSVSQQAVCQLQTTRIDEASPVLHSFSNCPFSLFLPFICDFLCV